VPLPAASIPCDYGAPILHDRMSDKVRHRRIALPRDGWGAGYRLAFQRPLANLFFQRTFAIGWKDERNDISRAERAGDGIYSVRFVPSRLGRSIKFRPVTANVGQSSPSRVPRKGDNLDLSTRYPTLSRD
jgi:hypothetical protein